LVLNGIGGRTVEEAKFNLSHVEFLDWVTYANSKGTLNLGLRVEYGLAMVCYLLTRGFKIKKESGASFQVQDFLPHIHQEEEGEDVTFESVARALGVKT
jgi:hypothetical protein